MPQRSTSSDLFPFDQCGGEKHLLGTARPIPPEHHDYYQCRGDVHGFEYRLPLCHSRAGVPAEELRIADLRWRWGVKCVLRSMTSFYVANRLARSIIESGLTEAVPQASKSRSMWSVSSGRRGKTPIGCHLGAERVPGLRHSEILLHGPCYFSVCIACVGRDARLVHCKGSADDRPAGGSHAAAWTSDFCQAPGRQRPPGLVGRSRDLHQRHSHDQVMRVLPGSQLASPAAGTVSSPSGLASLNQCLAGKETTPLPSPSVGQVTEVAPTTQPASPASDLLTNAKETPPETAASETWLGRRFQLLEVLIRDATQLRARQQSDPEVQRSAAERQCCGILATSAICCRRLFTTVGQKRCCSNSLRRWPEQNARTCICACPTPIMS